MRPSQAGKPTDKFTESENRCHPGRLIRAICNDTLHLTVTEAASALGVSRGTISRIINGKANISPDMAVRLSKVFGETPQFWTIAQMEYNSTRSAQDSLP